MKAQGPPVIRRTEPPINVLIVEDNPGDRIFIIHLLRSVETPRFELLHAPNLAAALERATDGIDVILLDLRLPDSEDLATLQRVHAAAPQIPIIVLTGVAGQRMGLEALSHGACDYLLKGKIDAHLLVQAIIRHVKGRKQRAAEMSKQ
jgi:CheY-like chemotaxis protein